MTEKLKQLIRVLADQTERGQLRWAEVDEDTFRAEVGDALIRIGRGTRRVEVEDGDWLTVPSYQITVTNADAKVVEDEECQEGDLTFTAVDRTFRAARRAAHRSDAVLDEILRTLEAKS